MTANPETLEKIAHIIRVELPKYLSPDFNINDVKAENRPGPDEEDYVHVFVILEDDHPKLDPQKTLDFRRDIRSLFDRVGIDQDPNISYANRSELSL